MNKLTIIGNLTRDPELRTTQTGVNVCSFTVAVNRRKTQSNPTPEADFFRVNAWRGLADLCSQFLVKGHKVAVTGPVSVSTWQASDGSTRAALNVTADEVEFLSHRSEGSAPAHTHKQPAPAGYEEAEGEELPF